MSWTEASAISVPANWRLPEYSEARQWGTSPHSARTRVVLPHPDGPITAVTFPASWSKLTCLRIHSCLPR